MMNIDEAIIHAKKIAKEKYNEGFLCHANPNDEKLDGCIECAKQHEQLAEWLGELREYKKLDEQGLLLKLPCKVGDTLYTLNQLPSGKITIGQTVADAFICALCMVEGRFSKTVFLTKAEAEEALKKMRGEG